MTADLAHALAVSADEALLIAAAGGRCAVAVRPGDELHWDRVVDAARWHRLGPMLWDHLRRRADGIEVPPEVLEVVRDGARRSTARSVNLQFELDRVLALLEREGIPAMLLKGAALVETGAYPEPGLRVMSDLDLLLPQEDLSRAHEMVASELGYLVHGARLTRDDDERMHRHHHHYQLVRKGGAVILELHHRRFFDRPTEHVDGLWERAERSDRSPVRYLPSPEDLLVHVAVHFGIDRVKLRDSALGQLADLVRITERWEIDWDAVVARCAEDRLTDRLFLALYSAEVLFGGVAPGDLVEGLRPESFTPQLGAALIQRRVLADGPMLPIDQVQVEGLRRMFPGREALERYVRFDEPTPSLARLRVRRYVSLGRRLATQLPRPVELVRDVRLSRWMNTLLRDERNPRSRAEARRR
jgi:hypothetical protein